MAAELATVIMMPGLDAGVVQLVQLRSGSHAREGKCSFCALSRQPDMAAAIVENELQGKALLQ